MDRDDDILDYLQDRLAPADRARFEAAMAGDKALAAEVDLMRSVRAELEAGPVHENADVVWDRLSSAMDPAPEAANETRAPWVGLLKYAAVAAVAVAAWQVSVVPRMSGAPGAFQPASEQPAAFVLQLKFSESAPFGEVAQLLGGLNGTIIDGPGALGLVLVSFPERDLQQTALDVLGTRNDLVEFALEP